MKVAMKGANDEGGDDEEGGGDDEREGFWGYLFIKLDEERL